MGLLNDSLDSFVQENVDYMNVWEVEKSIDLTSWRLWLASNPQYCIYIVAIYLAALLGGQRLMKDRKPLELQFLLTFWNIGLAVFNGIALTRTLPELVNVLSEDNGFHQSVCSR